MKRLFLLLALFLLSLNSGFAADGEADDDQAFDDAVRQFGYAGGAAWHCSAEKDRTAVERQALQAYTGLTRLFGTDQAFFFASSFGAGTMDKIKNEDCAKFIEAFNSEMAKAQKAQ
ncbi:MAG: hypothetical protein B7Y80_17810 [Hyphomicrobium sp. 32-62-53]|jgi:hypothetical protein|nr:MAG: hypothetical protein B7Z29_16995 [Hyphomicrobium sp. 12-62-95]OYX98005.1 MAG: hypothetical protein B7Y80_17810 [Hyphomicrobium sp. 32-62-53]